jgi:histidyl-tRNA synthetase
MGRALETERAMLEAVSGVYRRWGFVALETGALEYADALGKFLPDQDRPNEGVFALMDDDNQWLSLRYDLTAPLARFAAENWDSLPKPFRRYAFGPVWRNEKPGPGRFREFLQCDADTVGAPAPFADAEIVAMAVEALQAAGAAPDEVVLKVNTRQLLNAVLDAVGAERAGQRLTILRALDKLDRLGEAGVADLLGKGRRDESGDFTPGAGLEAAGVATLLAFAGAGRASRSATLEALGAVVGTGAEATAGLAALAGMDRVLSALGVGDAQVRFDPAVVRGLEYYTGPVFEAEFTREVRGDDGRPVRIGSVGGGGRYDDLVSRFRGELVPATGFSVGVSRLAAAFAAAEATTTRDGPVVVLVMDRDEIARSFAHASRLRAAGIPAEVYLGAAGMKAQMKYADRRGAPAVIIEGSSERGAGVVQIKDLALGEQLAQAITDNRAWKEERPGQIEAPAAELEAAVRAVLARQRRDTAP